MTATVVIAVESVGTCSLAVFSIWNQNIIISVCSY